MNSAWGPNLYDMAAWNLSQVEEVELFELEFEEMLVDNTDCTAWGKEMGLNDIPIVETVE